MRVAAADEHDVGAGDRAGPRHPPGVTGGGPWTRPLRGPRGRSAWRSSFFRMPDRLGRDLDQLVVVDPLEAVLEAHRAGAAMRRTASSWPEARMLVSFFSRQTFTSRSTSREYSPTIMPS